MTPTNPIVPDYSPTLNRAIASLEIEEGSSLSPIARAEENVEKLQELQKRGGEKSKRWSEETQELFAGLMYYQVEKVVCSALLDSYLGGRSVLQGSSHSTTSLVYKRLIKRYLELNPPKGDEEAKRWSDLHNQIDSLWENCSLPAQKWQSKLMALKSGERLTLPAGYSRPSAPGHAEIIAIEKRGNGNYNLYLYNSATGAKSYFSHSQEGANLRIYPRCSFIDIPADKFFDAERGRPSWMELLEGLHKIPKSSRESKYDFSDEDLQLRLLGPLQSFREKEGNFSTLPTLLAQRGGTCSWDSIDALVAVELQDEELREYRAFKAFANHTLLTSFYTFVKDNLFPWDQTKQNWELLATILKKVTKGGAKRAFAEKKVGDEAVEKGEEELLADASYILAKVEEWQEEIQKCDLSKKVTISPPRNLKREGLLGEKLHYFAPPSPFDFTEKVPFRTVAKELHETPSIEGLEGWCKSLKESYDSYRRAGHLSIAGRLLERTALLLPLPTEETERALRSLQLSALNTIAETLGELLLDYSQSYDKGTAVNSVETVAAEAILALVHQAAVAIDEKEKERGDRNADYPSLKEYGLYRQRHRDFLSLPPESAISSRVEAQEKYFKRVNSGDGRPFKKHELCAFSKHITISNDKNTDDLHYYRKLLRCDAAVKGAVSRQTKTSLRRDQILGKLEILEETHQAAELLTDFGGSYRIRKRWQVDVLKRHNLAHLVALKRAALACHFITGATESSSDKRAHGAIDYTTYAWPDSNGTEVISTVLAIGVERTWEEATSQKKKNRRRFLPKLMEDPAVCKLLKKVGDLLLTCDLAHEHAILICLKNSVGIFPSAAALAQAMTQKELRPQILLSHFSGELYQQIDEPLVQFLYELLMYKPTFWTRDDSPLAAASEDPCFTEPFTAWIEKILSNYSLQQEASAKNLETSLFAMRQWQKTAAMGEEAKKGLSLQRELHYYDVWLKNPGWNDGECALIHLYRASAIATRGVAEDESTLFAAMVTSWLHFLLSGADEKRVPKELVCRVESAIASKNGVAMLQKISGDENLSRRLFTAIAMRLELPIDKKQVWKQEQKDPLIFSVISSGKWSLNLLTGELYTPNGPSGIARDVDWTKKPLFARLFDGRVKNFKESGLTFTFHDTIYGYCRMKMYKRRLLIERKRGERWHSAIPPNDPLLQSLPTSLLVDHSHWFVREEGVNSIVICDLATGKELYTIDEKESVQSVEKEKWLVTSKGINQQSDSAANFSHFEAEAYIEEWEGIDQNTLTFPRLQSYSGEGEKKGEGEPLAFTIDKEGYKWAENPSYRIAEEQQLGLLGAIPNYLQLVSKEGATKLLLPVRKIKSKMEFTKLAAIEREDDVEVGNIASYSSKRLSSFAITFDRKRGGLHPTSELGKGYLAYVELTQRNYGKALELIESLERKAPDAALQEVLYWIAIHGGESCDHSPNAAAVRVAASEFLLRFHSLEKKGYLKRLLPEEKAVFFSSVKNDLTKYLQARNSLSEECLLDDKTGMGTKTVVESLFCHLKREYRGDHKDISLRQEELRALEECCKEKKANISYVQQYEAFNGGAFPPTIKPCKWRPQVTASHAVDIARILEELDKLTKINSPWKKSPLTREHLLSRRPEEWLPEKFRGLYENLCLTKGEISSYDLQTLWLIGGAMQASNIEQNAPAFFLYRLLLEVAKNPQKGWPAMPPFTSLQTYEADRALHAFFIGLYKEIKPTLKGGEAASIQFKRVKGGERRSSHYPRRSDFIGERLPAEPPFIITPPPSKIEEWPLLFEGRRRESAGLPLPEISFDESVVARLSNSQKEVVKLLLERANVGREKLQREMVYTLREDVDLSAKLTDMESFIKEVEKESQEAKRAIEMLISPNNSDPKKHLPEHLSVLSSGIGKVKFGKLLALYLAKDPSRYVEVNHHLESGERQHLDGLITYYLTQLTELQHLQRVKSAMERFQNSRSDGDKGHDTLQELAALINSGRSYDPQKSRDLLLFEAIDDKRIRDDQAKLLEKIEENPTENGIFALAMGGGKTSVIACIWSHLVAAKGKLPCLFVPEAQLATVRKNLQKIQKSAFSQDIVEISARGGDLSLEKLREIDGEVERAKREGHLLLLAPETLQHLELNTLSLCDTISRLPAGNKPPKELLRHVALGKKLVALFRNEPATFIDEVALLLSAKKEVNFPIGARKQMKNSTIELVRACMEILSSEEMEKIVQMQSNNQCEMREEVWERVVKCALAEELAKHPPLRLSSDRQKDAFVRYLLGKTPRVIESYVRLGEDSSLPKNLWRGEIDNFLQKNLSNDVELQKAFYSYVKREMRSTQDLAVKYRLEGYLESDSTMTAEVLAEKLGKSLYELRALSLTFRRELRRWTSEPYDPTSKMSFQSDTDDYTFLSTMVSYANSDNPRIKEIPDLVATARLLLQVVLPSVLKKRVNRHFGDARDATPGRICHYEAKDTPGTTDFRLDIEAAAIYMLTILSEKVTKEQVLFLAGEMELAARYYMKSSGETYEETAEAREFHALLGIALSEVNDGDKLARAIEKLNKERGKRLDFQALIVAHRVHRFDECLTNSSARFIDQLKTILGGSGTPWNYKTFGKRVAGNFFEDEVNDGKLLYTLLERATRNEGKTKSHSLENFDPKTVADLIVKESYSFLIDCGGRIDEIPELTKELLARSDKYSAVLFYHKGEGEKAYKSANRLALYRRGHSDAVAVGGSRFDDIAAHVDPEEVFFLFDQPHSIGTDFPMPKEAKGMMTVDAATTEEEFLQAAARARKILAKQRVDYAIVERSRPRFVGGGETPAQLIVQSAINSDKELVEEMKRSYRRRVANAVQQLPLGKKLFTEARDKKEVAAGEEMVEEYARYKELLITRNSDDTWKSYGLTERGVSFVDTLIALAEEVLQKLPQDGESDELKEVHRALEEIIEEAAKNPLLAERRENGCEIELGAEQEVSREIAVEQEVNREVELEGSQHLEYQQAQGEVPESRSIDILPKRPPSTHSDYVKTLSYKATKKAPPNLEELSLPEAKHYKKSKGKKYTTYREKLTQPLPHFFSSKLYHYRYDKLFSGNFSVNKNVSTPFVTPLSRFHRQFGSCDAALVYPLDDGSFHFIAIARSDAERFIKHTFEENDPWLITPQGILYAKHPHPLPYDPKVRGERMKEAQEIQDFLFELNLFNGNAAYFDTFVEELEKRWRTDMPLHNLRCRFLRLLVENDKLQKRSFFANPLFGGTPGSGGGGVIHPLRQQESRSADDDPLSSDIWATKASMVRNLDSKQIPLLNNKTFFLGTSYKMGQIDFLVGCEELRSHISTEQLVWSREKARHHKTLVQNLPIDRINSGDIALEECDLNLLSEWQVQMLDDALLGKITNRAILPWLHHDRLDAIHPSLVDHLDDALLPHLSDAKLLHLRDIRRLPSKRIIAIRSPELASRLEKEQIPYLSPLFVQNRLPIEMRHILMGCSALIDCLPDTEGLLDHQLYYIESQRLIDMVPDAKLHRTNPKLWNDIPIEKRKFLGTRCSDLIKLTDPRGLDKMQIHSLWGYSAKHLLERLSKEQVAWIDPKAVLYLPKELRKHLKDYVELLDQIDDAEGLDDFQIERLKTSRDCNRDRRLANSVPEEKRHLLDSDFIPYLYSQEGVTKEQVEKISLGYILDQLDDKRLLFVTKEQVSLLSISKMERLRHLVSEKRWQELREGISPKRISKFYGPALFELLTPKQIKENIGELQVQYLNHEWQIEALPDELLKELTKSQVAAIKSEKLRARLPAELL